MVRCCCKERLKTAPADSSSANGEARGPATKRKKMCESILTTCNPDTTSAYDKQTLSEGKPVAGPLKESARHCTDYACVVFFVRAARPLPAPEDPSVHLACSPHHCANGRGRDR